MPSNTLSRRSRALLTLTAVSLSVLASGVACAPQAPAATPAWMNVQLSLDARASALVRAMTLPEEVSLMTGMKPPTASKPAGFIPGIPRLKIAPLVFSDGPIGLGDSVSATGRRPATALPSEQALGATFDTALATSYGQLLGREARARGVDVLYGPGLNLDRTPVGGRAAEYFSEDPYLTSALGVGYVNGVQSQGVAAQAKHFILNDQENGRHNTSSNASARTLREVYLAPFQAAVQSAHLMSIMCGNNLVNGVYACQSPLLATIRHDWGFKGVVGSDYAATHSAVQSVNAGLDQSFTWRDWGAYYRDLPALVKAGKVSKATIDARATAVARLELQLGKLGPRPTPAVNLAADAGFARNTAAESTVLLKNSNGLLPLDTSALQRIAVIGPYATTLFPGASGSSRVIPAASVTPAAGIAARAPGVQVVTNDGSDPAAAAALAANADVAVVIATDSSGENADRPGLNLPGNQDALISQISAAQPRTVVALHTAGAVAMPWLDAAGAVLEQWYPGEEDGAALAAVLFGDSNPSGHLPVTFPTSAAQSPVMQPGQYPAGSSGYDYTEGLNVGYRGFDAANLTPLFPFGFGLSYTAFDYSGLSVLAPDASGVVRARFTVTNTGARAGVAVPQLYLAFPAAAGEPPWQLKSFTRVSLAAGASSTVTLSLPRSAFQVWAATGWKVVSGQFTVAVGPDSRSLGMNAPVTIAGS
jgi:beta-glucosidase